MPRTATVALPVDVLQERSTAYQAAYQAISDAIDTDVDNEIVDNAFLHPLNRARDYLGKESGKMARQLKAAQKASVNGQSATPPPASDPASAGKK